MPTDLPHARRALTALLTGAALAAAGCGGSSSGTATTTVATATSDATAPAETPTTPVASPGARMRDALLTVADLPLGWAPRSVPTPPYGWPHRDARCLATVRRPRDGAYGPLFEFDPEHYAAGIRQVVERHASDAAAQRAIDVFRSERARRCYLQTYESETRSAARTSEVRMRLAAFRSVQLDLPSVVHGDDAAGLRLCARAHYESGAFAGRASTSCTDLVMVRAGALTTLLHILPSRTIDATEADEFGEAAAQKLEEAATAG
jgi:hypothetical protein